MTTDFVLTAVTDVKAGNVCLLDGDDIAKLDCISQRADGSFIAWCVGDKLPIYFDQFEWVPVRP